MSRTLRYLRIAFSALCGIICLLLIVLWVRSYYFNEQVSGPAFGKHLAFQSRQGRAAMASRLSDKQLIERAALCSTL
jgi:hypothetical protein